MNRTALQKKGLMAAVLAVGMMTALFSATSSSLAAAEPPASLDETPCVQEEIQVQSLDDSSEEPISAEKMEGNMESGDEALPGTSGEPDISDEEYSEPEEFWEIGKITLSKSSFVYTGKAIKPSVTVKGTDGRTLKAGTDYTCSYSNNVKIGTASITIIGSSTYWGYITIPFKIIPAAPKLTSVKGAKKSVQTKWTAASAQATGYEILYSTSKSFGKSNKKIRIKSSRTKAKALKGLKRHKTYYVKVRVYKTVNGKTYYSAWSKVRKAGTK